MSALRGDLLTMDYRELLIKHMLCCIECEGSPCLLSEDDAEGEYTPNADIGISPEEYAELAALADEAKDRYRQTSHA